MTDTGYSAAKDESVKLVVPQQEDKPPTQSEVDRAVFEHNTAVAKAQLDYHNKLGARVAIVPDAGAEKELERSAKFNVEPAVAKAQVDADMVTGIAPQLAIVTESKAKASR